MKRCDYQQILPAPDGYVPVCAVKVQRLFQGRHCICDECKDIKEVI